MKPTVDVHAEGDLDVALATRAKVVGFNNYNIDMMVVSIFTAKHMDHLRKEMVLIPLST